MFIVVAASIHIDLELQHVGHVYLSRHVCTALEEQHAHAQKIQTNAYEFVTYFGVIIYVHVMCMWKSQPFNTDASLVARLLLMTLKNKHRQWALVMLADQMIHFQQVPTAYHACLEQELQKTEFGSTTWWQG